MHALPTTQNFDAGSCKTTAWYSEKPQSLLHTRPMTASSGIIACKVYDVRFKPNGKLTDRRPSETLDLPADVAGGGSVEHVVR